MLMGSRAHPFRGPHFHGFASNTACILDATGASTAPNRYYVRALTERSIVADVLRYVPAQMLPAAAGFLLVTILTRLLTVEQYGVYALAATTVAVLSSLADGWVSNSVLRFLANAEETGRASQVLRSGVLYVLGSDALVLAAAGLVGTFIYRGLPLDWLTFASFVAVLAVAASLTDTGQAALRAQTRVWAYGAFNAGRAFGRLAASALGAVVLPNALIGALLGWAASAWLIALSIGVAFRSRLRADIAPPQVSQAWFKTFMTYGAPVSLSLLLNVVLAEADRFLLQGFSGTHAVGIYSAVYQIANGAVIPSSLIMAATFPIFSRLYDRPDGRAQVAILMPGVIRLFLVVAVPVMVGLAVVSRPLLDLLTPRSYAVHSGLMLPVLAGVFFLGIGQYTTLGLLLAKRSELLMAVLAAAACSNVLLNLIMIPQLGMSGAAFATLVAYVVYACSGAVVGRRFLRFTVPVRSVARIFAAAASMALVAFVVGQVMGASTLSLAAAILCGAAAYGAVLLLAGELTTVIRPERLPLVRRPS